MPKLDSDTLTELLTDRRNSGAITSAEYQSALEDIQLVTRKGRK